MSKDAITPPLHRYRAEGPFGNCAVPWQGRKCCRKADSPVHRYYPCRKPGCMKDDCRSIEARDRHEATIHGNGW